MVSIFGCKSDTIFSIITNEVRVITILAETETGVRSDLPIWLRLAHPIVLIVCHVAFTLLVVLEGVLPTDEVFSSQGLITILLLARPFEEIQLTVVVLHEVEVELVLLLARKLWEKCFVACVVTLEPAKQ